MQEKEITFGDAMHEFFNVPRIEEFGTSAATESCPLNQNYRQLKNKFEDFLAL